MGTMNQFYITLPSNTIHSSSRNRPNDPVGQSKGNTQSDFRIHLPHRISLDGEWEVALCEIIYTHSWFNIDHNDDKDRYIMINDAAQRKTVVCEVEPGFYETAQELIGAVNTSVVRVCDALAIPPILKFVYDQITKRSAIKLGRKSEPTLLFMGEKLRYMLGFDIADLTRLKSERAEPLTLKAKYPVDLRGGLDTLYIYCDLISNQVVGDVTAPLLRVVAVEGHHDDVVSKLFINPHYLPLVKREFDTIEISIKDDRDKPIRFLYGKTIVKLHFRRKKFSLL